MTSNNDLMGIWVRKFLMEYLISDRNLSKNTQKSYRDTFMLLFPFLEKKLKKKLEKLSINDINPTIIRLFLQYLEKERNCCVATRNQRLAAIHAIAHFIGKQNPEYIAWSIEICSIPFKKTVIKPSTYLEKAEMSALLTAPDKNTKQGKRDYILLLFLYNTGTRVSEVTNITIADLNFEGIPAVRIVGKGNKERYCPLWKSTVKNLNLLITGRDKNEYVFLNRRKQPITRFGIYSLIKRLISKVSKQAPSLQKKRISPHTIRHTTAVHLLRAGVDINTIRAWLGHVSLDTTNIYTEIDLEMKATALQHCEIEGESENKKWSNNGKLMDFLKSI
jgi:site-specific recombinase XerD